MRLHSDERQRRAVWLASLCGLALACAHPYFAAPDAPRGDALRTLLVLPLNFAFTPPNEWRDGIERVQRLVRARLEASGHSVQTPSLRTVLEAWSSALRQVGSVGDAEDQVVEPRYQEARILLAKRLLADSDADAVVIPTIVPRRPRSRAGPCSGTA